MRLIANVQFRYPDDGDGPTHMVGDVFEATARDARVLVVTKLASPAPPEEPKRRYKHRAMKAEDSAEMFTEDK